jgi:hypothetical protein
MIDPDGDHAGHQGVEHIGGIESSTKAHFNDRDVDSRLRKHLERHGRRGLEKCGAQRLDNVRSPIDPIDDRILRHRYTLDPDTLSEVNEVRRAVHADTPPAPPQQGIERRAHAALAVGPANVKRMHGVVGAVERSE